MDKQIKKYIENISTALKNNWFLIVVLIYTLIIKSDLRKANKHIHDLESFYSLKMEKRNKEIKILRLKNDSIADERLIFKHRTIKLKNRVDGLEAYSKRLKIKSEALEKSKIKLESKIKYEIDKNLNIIYTDSSNHVRDSVRRKLLSR